MIPRLILAGLLLAILPGVVRPQEGGRVTFGTIIKGLETQRKMYNTDKRIVGTVKVYQIESKSGRFAATPYDDSDFEAVLDAAGNQRYTVNASRFKPDRVNFGFYATPEIRYIVKREGDQYFVHDFIDRNSNLSHFVLQRTEGAAWVASSFDGNRSLEFVSLLLKDNSRTTHLFSVGTPTRVTRSGREVVSVPYEFKPKAEFGDRAGGPARGTSYFDPSNSFA